MNQAIGLAIYVLVWYNEYKICVLTRGLRGWRLRRGSNLGDFGVATWGRDVVISRDLSSVE
jgi:hypothetical protein